MFILCLFVFICFLSIDSSLILMLIFPGLAGHVMDLYLMHLNQRELVMIQMHVLGVVMVVNYGMMVKQKHMEEHIGKVEKLLDVQ